MVYFDTSFIIPRYITEATSSKVEAVLIGLSESLTISQWTRVEFVSMLARRVRMQELTEEQALKIFALFEQEIKDSFNIIIPTATDFELAIHFLHQYQTGLRAGDALHLAISKNYGATMLYTLDNGLLKAASTLNIPARGIPT
ncbi:type II toxin-antitoxin system VapC family toxin [Candidatus Parabeggiatoa sp. HSG14]|uniref:type II toxin-antitoxin system VapC family toxin n=1 Tax=Candidatus Parabeggiatoa sp. HSG14 TaxID=3055593 RepID=UPI0025A8FD01|nr:type II toxin-antitoxin system VapC family toxin [Thiotrichales bacterium HSG14]